MCVDIIAFVAVVVAVVVMLVAVVAIVVADCPRYMCKYHCCCF